MRRWCVAWKTRITRKWIWLMGCLAGVSALCSILLWIYYDLREISQLVFYASV